MKFFTKKELKGIGIIFLFLFLISYPNFKAAIRRARDAQRRADLGSLSNALHKYHEDFGFFPPATDTGEILACRGDNYDEVADKLTKQDELDLELYFSGFKACNWGDDALEDLADDNYEAYIKLIHQDPKSSDGLSYYYFSNTVRFQLYAHLEGGAQEDGYDQEIVDRGVMCGTGVCNFGKTFGQTPLDKSIQEYENELLKSLTTK